MSSLSQNQRGICAIIVAMVLFVSNDAAMKTAGTTMPLSQTMFFRSLFAALLILAIIVVRRETAQIPHAFHRLVFLRGGLEIIGSFAFQGGLLLMPIGDMTAIVQIVPLILLGYAAVFLHEKIGFGRIVAVATGFAGAVLVAAPTGAISLGAWLAFVTALVVVCRDLLSRHIGRSISPLVVTLATGIIVGGSSLLMLLFDRPWIWPSPAGLAMTAAAGCFLACGYVAMTYAMIWGQVQALAPFYYSQTLFALFYSLVLFGDHPGILVMVGTAMIMAAGLYTALGARPRRSVAAEPARP